jgi:HSP20 family protein
MYEINPRSRPAAVDGISRVDPSMLASGIVNWNLTVMPRSWQPPTDLFETEERYVIRVEIAGMRDGEFSVSVENNLLTIHGTRADTNERRAFYQMEIHFGEFSSDIELPANVDVNQISASYDDGFLWVQLPKALPKHIKIGD